METRLLLQYAITRIFLVHRIYARYKFKKRLCSSERRNSERNCAQQMNEWFKLILFDGPNVMLLDTHFDALCE